MNQDILHHSLILVIFLFYNSILTQETILLKNSNLEQVDYEKSDFYWWQNQSKFNSKVNYSIEEKDVNYGSSKSLKVEVLSIGNEPWGASSSLNSNFKVQPKEEYTVSFYAKGGGDIKLVFQSEIKGTFQSKNFSLNNEWNKYTHTFSVNYSSNNAKVKFWYLSTSVYYIDDIKLIKESF